MRSPIRRAEPIDQSDVEEFLAMKETERALLDRLALIEKSLDETEARLIEQIDCGYDLTGLPYSIQIRETERRYPSWKNEFIERLGKDEADEVLENTEPKISRRLLVDNRDRL